MRRMFRRRLSVLALLDGIYLLLVCGRSEGIKVTGQNTTVKLGESASLISQLTDTTDRLTQVIWKKMTMGNPTMKAFLLINPDGQMRHSNGLEGRVQYIGNFNEKSGSIKVENMTLEDEGIYMCIYSVFKSGNFETSIHVTVWVEPDVEIVDAEAVAGGPESLLASCVASHARPLPEVFWRYRDLSLRAEANTTPHANGTVSVVSNLFGFPSKDLNQKVIHCVVKHNTRVEELVLDYTININYPPESVNITPVHPTNVKDFQCVVDSNPKPNFTWIRVNGRSPAYEGNRLILSQPSTDLNGLYICHASNPYGSLTGSLYVSFHTESSKVGWVLFGILVCVNVIAAILWIRKHKNCFKLWRPVPQNSD